MDELSDYVIVAAAIPAAAFFLSYGIGSPWYRSALGWVILLYAASVAAILGLVVYGVLAGERAHEAFRLPIALGLFGALTAKTVILYVERSRGRPKPTTVHRTMREVDTMTNPSAATPGPDHLAPGDTVTSSSPAVTLGPAKAIASGVVATVLGFLAPLGVAIADGAISGPEWVGIATATVLGAAAGFGITYATPTSVRAN